MARLLLRFFLLAGLFFGTWYALGRIDYLGHWQGRKLTRQAEEKAGTLLFEFLKKTQYELRSPQALETLDSLYTRIKTITDTSLSVIRVHVFKTEEVNAFAIPGNRIILYTGMVLACKTPEELAGVLAHETAHLRLGHVAERMAKEVGVSLLAALIGGQGNGEILGEVVHLLAGKAFDRSQEREADSMAVVYLNNAGIDAEPFGNLLFRLSRQSKDLPKEFEWVSTHPDTRDRVSDILKWRKGGDKEGKTVLSEKEWQAFKKAMDKDE